MFKPSLTVHKSLSGKVTVLECSEDHAKASKAYKECTEAGEVILQRGKAIKRKTVKTAAQIEKRDALLQSIEDEKEARVIAAKEKVIAEKESELESLKSKVPVKKVAKKKEA